MEHNKNGQSPETVCYHIPHDSLITASVLLGGDQLYVVSVEAGQDGVEVLLPPAQVQVHPAEEVQLSLALPLLQPLSVPVLSAALYVALPGPAAAPILGFILYQSTI